MVKLRHSVSTSSSPRFRRKGLRSDSGDLHLRKQMPLAGESVARRVSRVLLTRVFYVLWVAPAIDRRWQRTNQVPAVPKHDQPTVAVSF